MYIDKSFEGKETVLLINNLANLTVMNAMHHSWPAGLLQRCNNFASDVVTTLWQGLK